jgi:Xaa-Pro aminopeptidase
LVHGADVRVEAVTDVLLYGDTQRSAAMRHEIPISIGDPFLYAEVGGVNYVMTSGLERERIAAVRPDAELLDIADLGFYELLSSGLDREQVFLELIARAATRAGVGTAIVDFNFALGVAERLRADGITLIVDDATIKARRRVKSPGEMDGIRRAQRAAEAAMAVAESLLRSATPIDGTLHVDGRPLLAEHVRAAMRDSCWERGALLSPEAIVASVWQGFGHEPGSGPLPAGLPIEVDLWPQDSASGCWADMTRTFLIGTVPDEVARLEELVRAALEQVRAVVRPGVLGSELHAIACDLFEADGHPTQRTGPGDDATEGFQFSLGHGVGLEVHEDPVLGLGSGEPLVAGDVLAVEPGLWTRDFGGVRFEDLLLVTDGGCETLTSYPYDMAVG